MSSPRRLLETGTDPAQLLLRSALDDHPPADWSKRTRSALGLSAGVAATSSISSTAAAGIATKVTALGVTKVVGVGAAALCVALVGRDLARKHASAAPLPSTIVITQPALDVAPAVGEMAPPSQGSEQPADPAAPQEHARPTAVTSHSKATPAPSHASLTDEVAALEVARRALAEGAPDQAIVLLDRYQQQFPNGNLGPEATALRIRALLARGDRAKATAMAERFIQAHPTSPHARSLRRLLSLDQNP